MSRATSPLLYQRYGIWTVAKEWDTVRSTVYAAGMRSETPVVPLKVAPGSAMGTALTEHIRRLIVGSPFPGEDHRTICAKLRGLRGRVGKARILLLMRMDPLLAPFRAW